MYRIQLSKNTLCGFRLPVNISNVKWYQIKTKLALRNWKNIFLRQALNVIYKIKILKK